MSTIDRVRLIAPNSNVAVRDYSFSQICELTASLSKSDADIFWAGNESVVLPADSHFAVAGTNIKYMGPR